MKLIRGIHNLSQAPQEGCVLTIGNFDGVHRGHRALLQGLQEEGRKRNLPVMVMLFEPQPLELFATDKAPARLTRLREKPSVLCQMVHRPWQSFCRRSVWFRSRWIRRTTVRYRWNRSNSLSV